MNVLIVVTHLLGTGHLSRALTLGRAFHAAGHTIHLMSGGMSVPNFDFAGVDLIQLPSVNSDGVNFTTLLREDGSLADDSYLDNRVGMAVEAVEKIKPDVLITELYPFGRRVLREEFQAILHAAESLERRPVILTSIRDILAPPSKPEKARKTEEVVSRFYDGVLVHSDPEVVSLETSWPVTQALSEKLLYTGFVAPEAPAAHPEGLGAGEILVTAGGGSVGDALFTVSLEAAAQTPNLRWRILVGGYDSGRRIAALQKQVKSMNVTIEPTRPDFRALLANAKAAVSMCGYNTAMDLLQTGVPAVFVPFDSGGEVEQTLRAESLSQSSQFAVVKSVSLSADAICSALNGLKRGNARAKGNFSGAAETVRIAEKWKRHDNE